MNGSMYVWNFFLVEDRMKTTSHDHLGCMGPSVSTTKLQIKLAKRVDKYDENANMYRTSVDYCSGCTG